MNGTRNFKQSCFSIILSLFLITIFLYSFPFHAIALIVDSSKVKLDTKKENNDSFTIKGQDEGFSLDGADSVTLQFGSFSETIPLSSFSKHKHKLHYKGDKKKSGISNLLIDLEKGEFKAEGKNLNLDDLTNPVKVQLTAGEFAGCTVLKFREKKHQWEFYAKKDDQFLCVSPPVISQVTSRVFSDKDDVYPTGSMVRIDVEESSGANVVSGKIRITSASQGYDSGIRELTLNPIFYHWDVTDLNPSSDYVVEVTLEDAIGQTATDNSLIVTLTQNPPSINKLVSDVDVSVPAVGLPVRVVRTYIHDLGFDGPLGLGWTHTYLMQIVETPDGLVKVFNADGSGSFFKPNGVATIRIAQRRLSNADQKSRWQLRTQRKFWYFLLF